MPIHRTGGAIGKRLVPTGASASGIWQIGELEAARRDLIWPSTEDPFWSGVSLLLHFDGAGGAATFTDSSVNSLSPTLVGSPTISTSQSKFGGASGLFSGTNYLSYAANSGLFGFGTGDFTVEFWVYVISWNSQPVRFTTSGVSTNFSCEISASGQLGFWDGATFRTLGSAGAVVSGAWTHVAWSREAGAMRAFVNGVQVGTTTTITTSLSNTAAIQFPATANYSSANCYIDELRVTKGAARFRGNFTPAQDPYREVAATPVSSPNDITGLQLWLDGSEASTLYSATSGGTLVAADGEIARWEDRSGNARHFTQATAGRLPIRRTNVKNGRGAVEFTNDWLSGVYTYSIGSLFVVWQHPTTVAGDTQPAVVGSRTSSSEKVANSTLNYTLTLPSASAVAVDPAPSGGTHRLNGVTQLSAFNSFSTGVSARTAPDRWQYTSAVFTSVAGSKAIVLGADSFTAAGRLMQNGHIGEVIAYSSTLTTPQVASVEAYLVNKWGLA